jgi:dihydrofolate reductase
MGKVSTGLSMSLNGFIAGPNDGAGQPLGEGGERLFARYSGGDTEYGLPGTEMAFEVSPQSAEFLREVENTMGASVTGRRTFDISGGWGGRPKGACHLRGHPHGPARMGLRRIAFRVRHGRVESAVRQAKAVAAEKDVAVMAASIVQQCIGAGLLDDIAVNLVPVLLGEGVRLFEHLGTAPIELESTGVIETPGVTHLKFRVVK